MRVAWGLEEGQEGPIPNRGVTQSSCMGMDHLDCGVGEGVGPSPLRRLQRSGEWGSQGAAPLGAEPRCFITGN